ncbi:MAG: fluoride efflux transporter CrcB [Pseudonocardiaceae bacterium]
MTWSLVALVGLGAAVGAPLRYLTDRTVQARHDTVFPWGTFTVNVVGSLFLGAVTAASRQLGPPVAVALGVGFCGALTTYSTFGYETLRLLEGRARFPAVANVVASVVAGVGAAIVGFALGAALT